MQPGADRAVTALATSQHGALGTRQAADQGVTEKERRTRVARGQWLSPHPRVLVVAGAPDTWHQRVMIAVLASGGVASHRCAAGLHELDGFTPGAPEVSVLNGRMPRLPDVTVHRVAALEPADVTIVAGIPTTNVARTLCDLGAVVDDDRLEQALDDALGKGFSKRWIVQTLDRLDRPGPSGTHSLRRVLARPDRNGRLPDSRFERLVERLVVAGGLPRPVRQHPVHDADGKLIGRVDVAWPDVRLGLEATSERWHAGPRRGRGDQLRDRRIRRRDWELLYPAWQDTVEPAEFVATTLDIYRRRLARIPPLTGGNGAS